MHYTKNDTKTFFCKPVLYNTGFFSFIQISLDSIVSSPLEDVGSERIPNEILPRYPVESESETFIMPQEMNPDIIEGPPVNIDEEVGAINDRILEEIENKEV